MSINNITRTNTVDEWRIQTNAAASELNKLETGNYVKSAGTLSVTGAANVIIGGTGTALQVTNTALFSTSVIVGKDISLGAQETASGNLGVGGVTTIYGPGTGLYVANNVISNGSLVVKNSIVTSNVTVNSNVVVVGTANIGYIGVANSAVIGKSATIGTTLDVTGNTTVGNLTTSNVVQTNIIRADTYGTFGTNVTVGSNTTTGFLTSHGTIVGEDNLLITTSATIGTSAAIGATLDVTGNTTSGNLTTSNATSTGTLRVGGTATVATSLTVGTTLGVTGNLTAGNVNTSNTVYAGTLKTTGRADVGALTATSFETISGGDATIAGKLTVQGDFVLSGDIVYDTDVLSISSITPITTTGAGYFGVFRGNTTGGYAGANVNSLGTVSDANAYIRWSASANNWQIRDVFNKDNTTSYSKVLTANLITVSTATTSNDTFASSWLTKNYVDNANTNLKSYVDVSAIAAGQANVGAARIADLATTQANTGAGNIIVRSRADGAYAVANLASNTFNGTSGSVNPSNGVISFATNNGMVVAGSSNTLTISTPQDLRSTASPTFASLTLTAPLAIAQGGTGATSAGSALTALLPTGTTAGYVLTTNGPGSFYWAAGGSGGGGTAPGTRIATTRLEYTGNGAGYHYATPTFSDATQLRVYIDGVRQMASEYSANISNSRVMLTEAPRTGSPILVEVDGYTTYEYYANNITYGPVTGSIPSSANTIQLAIDSLESRKAALAGAAFTGLVTGTTQNANTSNTAMATTAYVQAALNLAGNTFTHSITGNAGTVTNGVYTSGSYSDPAWITGLSGNKITVASTSVKGVVQLADSVSNTSTTAAATANAVKLALDAAKTYYTGTSPISVSSGGISIQAASATQAGYMSSTYASKLDGIASGATNVTNTNQLTNGAGFYKSGDAMSTGALTVTGAITATGDITAYYSDDRLKVRKTNIQNALAKLMTLNGFEYEANEIAQALGYEVKPEVGVSAQEVQKVLPEVVVPAPIDEQYLTVKYERLVPLLIEAIKELKSEVEELKGQIK